MANNLSFVIEILIKNKAILDDMIKEIQEKYGIEIDTEAADEAVKELESAVDGIGDADVSIDADNTGAVDAANEAESEIDEIPEEHDTNITATNNASQIITAISTAYITLSQLASQAKQQVDKLTNASNIQEDAEVNLAAALKNTGRYSKETFENLKNYASGLQEVTRYGDEAILSGMALAQNIGEFAEDELPKVTDAAIGLASAYKMDLNTAFNLIARGRKGQTQTLTRYGIVLDTTKTKEEQFAQLLEQGADKLDLAKDAAESGAGKLEQYKNAIGDLQEELGDLLKTVILPLVSKLHSATKTATDFFDSLTKTSLEQTIDDLREMGQDTLKLELALAKATEAKAKYAAIGLGSENEISEQLEESTKKRAELLTELGNKQAELLINEGKSEDYYRNIVKLYEAAAVAGDYTVDNTYIEAVNALKTLDALHKQLKEEENKNKELKENLVTVQKSEAAHELVLQLQKGINQQINGQNNKLKTQEKNITDITEAYINLGKGLGFKFPEMPEYKPPDFSNVKQSLSELMSLFAQNTEQLENLRKAGIDTTSLLDEQWKIFTNNVKQYYGEDSATYLAVLNMKKDADREYFEWKKEKWLEEHQFESGIFKSLESGYDKFVSSMTDMEMTGKERREAVWESLRSSFINMLGDMLKKYIANLVMQAVIGKASQAASIASAITTGTTIASAYAPAAAMTSLASFGANSVPAMAGITSTTTLAQLLAIPQFGKGTVVEKETVAVIGEKGTEAVVPMPDGKTIPVTITQKGGGGTTKIIIDTSALENKMDKLIASSKKMEKAIKNKQLSGTLEMKDKRSGVDRYEAHLKDKAEYERRLK